MTRRRTPERQAWHNMLSRCYYARDKRFSYYGGRGIGVCDRWRTSFSAFLADMGQRPSSDHSLDRIDSNGAYCPENCRWSTRIEQQRNRRDNIRITYNGETKTAPEWAETTGINDDAIRQRIARGWTVETALTTPVEKYGPAQNERRAMVARERAIRVCRERAESSEPTTAAERIRWCRRASGSPSRDIAAACGFSRAWFGQVETGRIRPENSRVSIIMALAEFFGVSFQWLIDGGPLPSIDSVRNSAVRAMHARQAA